MVKFHSYPLPDAGLTQDDVPAHRKKSIEADLSSLTDLRVQLLEKDIYVWFGCAVPLEEFRHDPQGAYKHLEQAVGMSLTEQKERLLDLVEEIVITMTDHACPPGKHYEDWDLEGLERAYREQFAISATGIHEISDRAELLQKLYADAAAVQERKEQEFGTENFLRLFRDLYLQEIDKQWMDHLQGMDHLRDGIGLRGYGQRDPKKEYQREGFDMYLEMVQSVKSSVTLGMFTVERAGAPATDSREPSGRRPGRWRPAAAIGPQQAGTPGGGKARPACWRRGSRSAASAATCRRAASDGQARPAQARSQRPLLLRQRQEVQELPLPRRPGCNLAAVTPIW
jgi:preprotein translocase subunit SecA